MNLIVILFAATSCLPMVDCRLLFPGCEARCFTHSLSFTDINTHTHKNTHTHTHKNTHTHTQTNTHTQTHSCSHSLSFTYINLSALFNQLYFSVRNEETAEGSWTVGPHVLSSIGFPYRTFCQTSELTLLHLGNRSSRPIGGHWVNCSQIDISPLYISSLPCLIFCLSTTFARAATRTPATGWTQYLP